MNNERVILAENCVFSTDSRETGLNNNVLVVGGTGCGKTMSVSEPRLLETTQSSLIMTITKRRLVDQYTGLFKEREYRVLDLNFVHPGDGNVGYDPLAFVHNDRDIRHLAETIVKANPGKASARGVDPFWDDAAISLLSAEIALIRMTIPRANLADVLEFHDKLEIREGRSSIETTLDQAFSALEEKKPHCMAVSCWRTFSMLPMKTASCVYSTLNTTLDSLFSPEVRKLMSKWKQVDLRVLASRKTLLFVTTSPVNPALNYLVNMFYGNVFKELFEYAEERRSGVLPLPVHVLCDDFATGGQILNFPEYISIFREKGLSVTLLLQSESQLEAMYGEGQATTIINNCDTYLYMGGMDLQTCQNISQRLNRPLEEVLYMPIGQVTLFRRGSQPVVTRRYDIRRDERYRKLTESERQR